MTTRLRRRVVRGLELVQRWAHELRDSEDPRRTLRELAAWGATTFGRSSPLDEQRPWLTFAAERFLEGYLAPTMRVFEWGSGGSSLFLARRVASVVAIEHERAWADRVQQRAQALGVTNLALQCIPGEAVASPSVDPEYRSSDAACAGLSFRRYVEAIAAAPDGYFELVIIDGRARQACARLAGAKVKPGGVVLLDNAEREDVVPALSLFPADEWRRLDFDGPGPWSLWPAFWRTTAFIRRPALG